MEHLQGAEIIYRLNLDIPLVCGIHDSEIHSKHRFTMVHMGLFEHGVSTNFDGQSLNKYIYIYILFYICHNIHNHFPV